MKTTKEFMIWNWSEIDIDIVAWMEVDSLVTFNEWAFEKMETMSFRQLHYKNLGK